MGRKLTNRLIDELLNLEVELKAFKNSVMYDKRYINWLEKKLGGEPRNEYLKERMAEYRRYDQRPKETIKNSTENV